jgi:hypothetical protein
MQARGLFRCGAPQREAMRGVLLLSIAALGAAGAASGEGFSIDAASPSASSGANSAFLSSGPVGGPPVVEETAASLGLSGGSSDEMNSMTFGGPAPGSTFYFSVDRASVGLAGDVVTEAALGQAAGDLYTLTVPTGSNVLVLNQDELGLAPASASGTPATPPIDDVDAFDFDYGGSTMGSGILTGFTLASGHPLSGTAVGCGGDVFIDSGWILPYAAYFGLASCADDVDAYETDGTLNTVYFSLAPGSPSLAAGSPISGCAAGCSPADIFIKSQGGVAILLYTAADLGLRTTDNVDAIAFGPAPDEPEPPPDPVPGLSPAGGAALVALMLGCAAGASRARQRPGRNYLA